MEQLAVALPHPLRVPNEPLPPPLRPAHLAGLAAAHHIEDLRKGLGRLRLVEELQPRLTANGPGELAVRTVELGSGTRRGPPVAEAPVDHTLGRQQGGDRNATPAEVV